MVQKNTMLKPPFADTAVGDEMDTDFAHLTKRNLARGVHGLQLDFLKPDSGCVWQDPDSGFLNKNRIRTRFGFCNLLMKNGLWDWAVPVIAN